MRISLSTNSKIPKIKSAFLAGTRALRDRLWQDIEDCPAEGALLLRKHQFFMNTTYITQLTHLYEKGAWFGDTYLEKLQDVTEEEAFRQPSPGIYSIAELIAHVIYWRSPLIKRLSNEKEYAAKSDNPDNWPSVESLKKKGWKKILADFDESQKQLTRLLKQAPPEFFTEEYSPGNSWAYVTDGTIQHDIYHLGQLGLMKRMVRGKSN